jgi:hypothetical protein
MKAGTSEKAQKGTQDGIHTLRVFYKRYNNQRTTISETKKIPIYHKRL